MDVKTRSDDTAYHPVDVAIGGRIRDARLSYGLTQDDLAKAIDISYQQLHKYEKGANRVSVSRLWMLAIALKVPIEYFFADLNEGAEPLGDPPRSRSRKLTLDGLCYWVR